MTLSDVAGAMAVSGPRGRQVWANAQVASGSLSVLMRIFTDIDVGVTRVTSETQKGLRAKWGVSRRVACRDRALFMYADRGSFTWLPGGALRLGDAAATRADHNGVVRRHRRSAAFFAALRHADTRHVWKSHVWGSGRANFFHVVTER